MIHVERKPAPSIFEALPIRQRSLIALRTWLTAPRESRGAPPLLDLNLNRLRSVTEAVADTFANKCGFCESRIDGSQQTLVYFRPLSDVTPQATPAEAFHYAWLAWDWSNFYLACDHCFRLRGSRFPVEQQRAQPDLTHLDRLNAYPYFECEKPLLIDPCIEMPVAHLEFDEDGRIHARDGSQRGAQTIQAFDLNREALIRRRAEEAQQIKLAWLQVSGLTLAGANESNKEYVALIQRLVAACQPTTQFTGMKAYLLISWMTGDRMAADSGTIFRNALEKAPLQELHEAAKRVLHIKKTSDGPDALGVTESCAPLRPAPCTAQIVKIYIRGDLYQIGSISDSNVVMGRNGRVDVKG